jgi:CII-binding regulator of phage lambda lysogenization HflD
VFVGILGSPLARFASSLMALNRALVSPGKTQADVNNALEAANTERKKFLQEEDQPSDRKIMAATAMMYYNDVDKNEQPIDFYQGIKDKFGSLFD